MNELLLTITEQDLDKAIQSRLKENYNVTGECLVAQALQRQFPNEPHVVAGFSTITIGTKSFECNRYMDDLVTTFLSDDYEIVRSQLPMTLNFERMP